jgi:hypothetical protein
MYIAQQFLPKFSTTKCHKNPLISFQAVLCMHADKWMGSQMLHSHMIKSALNCEMLPLLSTIQPPATFGHV